MSLALLQISSELIAVWCSSDICGYLQLHRSETDAKISECQTQESSVSILPYESQAAFASKSRPYERLGEY